MKYKVIFSVAAVKELEDSFYWYEERIDQLGERFLDTIDNAIELIAVYPEHYPQKHGNYRELTVKKFPFVIVYELDEARGAVYVLHVFHMKRNPLVKHRKK